MLELYIEHLVQTAVLLTAADLPPPASPTVCSELAFRTLSLNDSIFPSPPNALTLGGRLGIFVGLVTDPLNLRKRNPDWIPHFVLKGLY